MSEVEKTNIGWAYHNGRALIGPKELPSHAYIFCLFLTTLFVEFSGWSFMHS